MGNRAFLTLQGQRQGIIAGSVTEQGHVGSILLHGYSHALVSPRDPATGQATGHRQHGLLTVIKDVDKSSPPLRAAWSNNENLTTVQLSFLAPSSTAGQPGAMVRFFSINLTNANVTAITNRMAPGTEPEGLLFREELSFSYEKILWTFLDGGIMSEDDFAPQP